VAATAAEEEAAEAAAAAAAQETAEVPVFKGLLDMSRFDDTSESPAGVTPPFPGLQQARAHLQFINRVGVWHYATYIER